MSWEETHPEGAVALLAHVCKPQDRVKCVLVVACMLPNVRTETPTHPLDVQSHGREVDEEGWNSSGNDSDRVQRSATSTPQPARLRSPSSQAPRPDPATSQGTEDLHVASRSRSAFVPRHFKQVRHSPAGMPSLLTI